MAAIDCPKRGQPVMDDACFLREAEPYQVLPCGLLGLATPRWLALLQAGGVLGAGSS